MNDREQEQFEAELRKLAPAQPPPELMRKLVTLGRAAEKPAGFEARPSPSRVSGPSSVLHPQFSWRRLLRWAAPAIAVGAAVLAILLWRAPHPEAMPPAKNAAASTDPVVTADDVELDQQLVVAFDAIGRLPNGEPVRFRCREWTDELVLRDSARGIVIEQRSPRLEVVPVSFEMY